MQATCWKWRCGHSPALHAQEHEYKLGLGATMVPREEFLARFHEARRRRNRLNELVLADGSVPPALDLGGERGAASTSAERHDSRGSASCDVADVERRRLQVMATA